MRRRLLSAVAVVFAAVAQPAAAYWSMPGTGLGSLSVDTLPSGPQPSATAAAQTVTVSVSQISFHGTLLGAYANAGYVVRRYPAAGGSATTPAGTCGSTLSGTAATLSCQEPGVPVGSWRYAVTPVLGTWTGAESALSATVVSRLPAPVLSSVAAQNPATGVTTGSIQVNWAAVSGASGYNVYRRSGPGAYDYTAPLNGTTPLTATTLLDSGAGLSTGTTYHYVVRAVAANESLDSNELSATTVGRPAAPATPTATAGAGASIAVAWPAVSGAAGYNVYRRTTSGSFNFSAPLNGASPVTATSYTDATGVNATAYVYVVRAEATGVGGVQLEGSSSPESPTVTADGVAPAAPTSVTVGGTGPVLAAATCVYAKNTRFVNAAGVAAVPITVAIATPETGETVVVSAVTPGSTAVTRTVSATSTSVGVTLDLSSLADGTVTITARTADSAGNQSATVAPATATVRDTAAQLTSLAYADAANGTTDKLSGTSECGAQITAVERTGPHVGRTFTAVTVSAANGTFTGYALDAIKGSVAGVAYAYDVTATDLAANATTVSVSGLDTQ